MTVTPKPVRFAKIADDAVDAVATALEEAADRRVTVARRAAAQLRSEVDASPSLLERPPSEGLEALYAFLVEADQLAEAATAITASIPGGDPSHPTLEALARVRQLEAQLAELEQAATTIAPAVAHDPTAPVVDATRVDELTADLAAVREDLEVITGQRDAARTEAAANATLADRLEAQVAERDATVAKLEGDLRPVLLRLGQLEAAAKTGTAPLAAAVTEAALTYALAGVSEPDGRRAIRRLDAADDLLDALAAADAPLAGLLDQLDDAERIDDTDPVTTTPVTEADLVANPDTEEVPPSAEFHSPAPNPDDVDPATLRDPDGDHPEGGPDEDTVDPLTDEQLAASSRDDLIAHAKAYPTDLGRCLRLELAREKPRASALEKLNGLIRSTTGTSFAWLLSLDDADLEALDHAAKGAGTFGEAITAELTRRGRRPAGPGEGFDAQLLEVDDDGVARPVADAVTAALDEAAARNAAIDAAEAALDAAEGGQAGPEVIDPEVTADDANELDGIVDALHAANAAAGVTADEVPLDLEALTTPEVEAIATGEPFLAEASANALETTPPAIVDAARAELARRGHQLPGTLEELIEQTDAAAEDAVARAVDAFESASPTGYDPADPDAGVDDQGFPL